MRLSLRPLDEFYGLHRPVPGVHLSHPSSALDDICGLPPRQRARAGEPCPLASRRLSARLMDMGRTQCHTSSCAPQCPPSALVAWSAHVASLVPVLPPSAPFPLVRPGFSLLLADSSQNSQPMTLFLVWESGHLLRMLRMVSLRGVWSGSLSMLCDAVPGSASWPWLCGQPAGVLLSVPPVFRRFLGATTSELI